MAPRHDEHTRHNEQKEGSDVGEDDASVQDAVVHVDNFLVLEPRQSDISRPWMIVEGHIFRRSVFILSGLIIGIGVGEGLTDREVIGRG